MVVIAIIAALAAILLPVIANLTELARYQACMKNLAEHGKSFHNYKTANQNKLPALVRGGNPGQKVDSTTCKGAVDDALSGPKRGEIRTALGTNAMQGMWLIIEAGYMGGGERAYKCPGDKDWRSRSIPDAQKTDSRFGWTSAFNYSYGIHFPYAATEQTNTGTADNPVYEIPTSDGSDSKLNWADPNGIVSADSDARGKPMYQENCIWMADRNPREVGSDGGPADSGWKTTYPGNSNHEAGTVTLEKGGSNTTADTVDGKVGMGADDIYQNRGDGSVNGSTGGLPSYKGEYDTNKLAKYPVTDTVIWPLSWRSKERAASPPP